MVESKRLPCEPSFTADDSPPLVPVSAGEPLDHVWHLEAVPVLAEPSAPSYVYDDNRPMSVYFSSSSSSSEPVRVSAPEQPSVALPEPAAPHHYHHDDNDWVVHMADTTADTSDATTTRAPRFPSTTCTVPHAAAAAAAEPVPSLDHEDDDVAERSLTVGAGVATGILGLLLGGPVVGLVCGSGAAILAASHDRSAWGDTARAVGRVAITAQRQAQAVNRKHRVLDRSRRAARDTWRQVRQLDAKHHLLSQAAQVLQSCWQTTRDVCRRHRLVEKSVRALGQVVVWSWKQAQAQLLEASSSLANGQSQQPLAVTA